VKACIIMPNVSNPLGSTMSDASKKRLVQMLGERDVPLIEDGVYNALHFAPTPPYAAKAYDRRNSVMLCSSFTKCLAPGIRVGWVAPGRYYEQVQILKFMNTGGLPELLQLTVAEFLENGGYDRHLRSVSRTYERLTGLAQGAVARHFPAGTRVTRPSGGFVVWAELPKAVDAVELFELAMKEKIGFAPGPMFSATNRYPNCLRLSCAVAWTARIEAAYARLGELAHRLLERNIRRAA
jgi:DNA-binding transcriptional MocR family regulator